MKNFVVSYKRNNVYQALIVKAESLEAAENFFKGYKPDAVFYGATEREDISTEIKKGMPIITAE